MATLEIDDLVFQKLQDLSKEEEINISSLIELLIDRYINMNNILLKTQALDADDINFSDENLKDILQAISALDKND